MTDWKRKYQEFIVALRKMNPPSEIKVPGMRLGFVMHQLGEHPDDPRWLAELPIAFEAFHTKLARAKIRAVT